MKTRSTIVKHTNLHDPELADATLENITIRREVKLHVNLNVEKRLT